MVKFLNVINRHKKLTLFIVGGLIVVGTVSFLTSLKGQLMLAFIASAFLFASVVVGGFIYLKSRPKRSVVFKVNFQYKEPTPKIFTHHGPHKLHAKITATTTGLGPDRYNVNWNGGDVKVQTLASHAPDATMIIDGRRISVTFYGDDVSDWYIGIEERTFKLAAPKVKRSATQDDNSALHVTAPMHGRLSDILISVGQSVKQGQHVASIEAMKMHHEVRAARDGVIKSVRVEVGQQVVEGAVLADFD